MERFCRCKHSEVSHDAHGLSGCFWCKCKCFKFDRTESINAHNHLKVYRAANTTAGLFSEESTTK